MLYQGSGVGTSFVFCGGLVAVIGRGDAGDGRGV